MNAAKLVQRLSEHAASLIAENVKSGGYTHVVAAHSVFGRDVIPRAAALLGLQPISNITFITGDEADSTETSCLPLSHLANYDVPSSFHAPHLRWQRGYDPPVHRAHQIPHYQALVLPRL
jgi:hypothetical protein